MSDIQAVPSLSNEQKLIILNEWNSRPANNPPSIIELVHKIVGPGYDARSIWGRLVKEFIAQQSLAKNDKNITKKENKDSKESRLAKSEDKLEILTQDQQILIAKNISLPIQDLAKLVFNKENLVPESNEFAIITQFIKSLPPSLVKKQVEKKNEVLQLEILPKGPLVYAPPTTITEAAEKVNKVIHNCIDFDKLRKDTSLNKSLTYLIRFCHTFRFGIVYSNYKTQQSKELFEGSFIRFVWDKPDLTEEELDLYINLCSDIVELTNIHHEIDEIKEMLQQSAADSDNKKFSMTLVESLKNLREGKDKLNDRIKKTTELLQGKRNERIDTKTRENHSLTQLIDFVKTEENRRKLILLKQARDQKLKNEIKRIETLEDLKIEVHGMTEEELLS